MYKRPSDGKFETHLERERRLAHNVRMQFNRTFESSHLSAWIFSNLLLFYLFVFETGYEIAASHANCICHKCLHSIWLWSFFTFGPYTAGSCPPEVLKAAAGRRYSPLGRRCVGSGMLHIYTCMYVCMYVCTYVRTYVCMYVCM